MSIRSSFGLVLKKLLARQGYALTRSNQLQRITMEGAIQAMLQRNDSFNTVIDVGASDGRWSLQLMQHYPACQYLLIEAQPIHEEALQRFCADHANAQYVLQAAGGSPGELYFKANRPFGGQASFSPFAEHTITVPVTTVDLEVQSRQLQGPYLLKLDTHGFEVPILAGARQVLERSEVLVIECYNFRISPECLLFYEMCERLATLGFRCIDLVDLRQRPYDDAFWQMDMVFIRDDRQELAYSEFR